MKTNQWFAAAITKHVEDFALLMGENNVAILGKDDKTHTFLGIPAVTKQSPILMCMEYPVLLPDHTFVAASKRKLIPSIYALREIKLSGLTYSGPIHAAVRSLKHDNADAFAGFDDLKNLLENDNFKPFLKQEDGSIRLTWIFTRDGNDGPRFPKTRKALTNFFKENDIDFFFAACNTRGLSAYHFIERRIATMSREHDGFILPHDYYGTHLNCNGNTTDRGKELQNFRKAGNLLPDIWSNAVIDSYPVSASWLDPSEEASNFKEFVGNNLKSWLDEHVRIFKYCLQISKCRNDERCKPLRMNVHDV